MIQALHIGASGLKAQQKNIDVIANNMANINTTGFKKSQVEFKDTLYAAMDNFSGADINLQAGSGTTISTIAKGMGQGSFQKTDNLMDCMINGPGFFSVKNTNGTGSQYTKNGSFKLSVGAEGTFLTNNGRYALDNQGQQIKIPGTAGNVKIKEDGTVIGKDGAIIATLAITKFENPLGLLENGDNLYSESVSSGAPVLETGAKLTTGGVEASNVDMAQEMTDLMISQRAYQMASRIITTADQMAGVANNIR